MPELVPRPQRRRRLRVLRFDACAADLLLLRRRPLHPAQPAEEHQGEAALGQLGHGAVGPACQERREGRALQDPLQGAGFQVRLLMIACYGNLL